MSFSFFIFGRQKFGHDAHASWPILIPVLGLVTGQAFGACFQVFYVLLLTLSILIIYITAFLQHGRYWFCCDLYFVLLRRRDYVLKFYSDFSICVGLLDPDGQVIDLIHGTAEFFMGLLDYRHTETVVN